jgi:hypothetical protein
MAKYNQNEQKQWTYASIGYTTENANNNSDFTGDRGKQITQIIGPNTTSPVTMSTSEKNFSPRP